MECAPPAEYRKREERSKRMDKKTEAASLAAKLPAEKLESVLRYMRILVRMKGTRSPEAEAINSSLQARIEAGELTLPEAGEIMDEIEAALEAAEENGGNL